MGGTDAPDLSGSDTQTWSAPTGLALRAGQPRHRPGRRLIERVCGFWEADRPLLSADDGLGTTGTQRSRPRLQQDAPSPAPPPASPLPVHGTGRPQDAEETAVTRGQAHCSLATPPSSPLSSAGPGGGQRQAWPGPATCSQHVTHPARWPQSLKSRGGRSPTLRAPNTFPGPCPRGKLVLGRPGDNRRALF